MEFLLWTMGPAILLSLGNILQKIGLERVAHNVHVKRPSEWIRTVIQNFSWWCGIGVSAVATIAYFGALGRYNISLVQPMMSLNPVLTVLVGWLFLKEHLDRRTALAIFFVVLGLGVAGMLHGEAHGQESELHLALYAVACAAGIGLVRVFIHNAEARKSLIGGVGFGLSAVFMKSLEGHFFAQGGALSIALMCDWGMVIRALAFVATYLIGFVYMQVALTHGRALFVIPLTAAIGMLVPTIAGMVVFQEPFGVAKLCALGLVALGSALFIKLK